MKTLYDIRVVTTTKKSVNFIQKAVRESLKNIFKGSGRIRFVLQEKLYREALGFGDCTNRKDEK